MGLLVFPENVVPVSGTPIATTNGGITCDYISCKNAHRVIIVASLLQAATHTTALGVNEATAVAGTSAAAITATMPIWKVADVATSDVWVRGTDAASVSATAGTTNQLLMIQLDPAILSSGFDCIAATLSDSSEATNFACVNYFIEPRYPQAANTSFIVD